MGKIIPSENVLIGRIKGVQTVSMQIGNTHLSMTPTMKQTIRSVQLTSTSFRSGEAGSIMEDDIQRPDSISGFIFYISFCEIFMLLNL